MPSQPLNILVGHNARVEFVCVDYMTNTIVSLSADNYVKVWDIADTKVTQSFNANYVHLQPHDVSAVTFNPGDGKLILGTKEMVYRERTGNIGGARKGVGGASKVEDPKSHGKGVTCVLYNPVFEVIVSADQYSTICVWEYKTGKKQMQFSGCHLWNINGRIINLEITAMTFDPTYRRLFTGSKDGLVKVWNFNNGSCLDEYETCEENEIGGLVYTRNRLFTGGWSKNVYCIFDAKEDEDRDIKCWDQKHVDDIQCITRVGLFVVSADYDGDIIFWYSDTGRFAFRYNVNECAASIQTPQELEFNESLTDVIGSKSRAESRRSVYTGRRSKMASSRENIYNRHRGSGFSQHSSGRKFHSASKRIVEPLEEKYCSVVSMTAMNARVLEPTTATLFTATSFGWIYAWAASVGTKMIGQFFAAKMEKIPVNATATDPENLLLVTGDAKGYIRVWSIKRIAIGVKERQRILDVEDYNFPFPFAPYMKKIRKELSSKEPVEIFADIPKLTVPLLASFQAHAGPVTAIDMIPESHLIATGSSDGTVKLFTVAGKSIGTFGQPRAWRSINYYLSDSSRGSIPHGLKRSVSPMSNLVMRGRKNDYWQTLRTIFKSSQLRDTAMQPARTVRAELRRNTESSDSENDTADGGKGLAGLNAEEQEELFRDDFSFDIKSDVLGVAYKNKEKSNKAKYMGGFQERQSLVDNNDIYHNLHVDHELAKLPDLPKPPLLKEVLAKQAAIQSDIQKMRQRQGFLRAVKIAGGGAAGGGGFGGPKDSFRSKMSKLTSNNVSSSINNNINKTTSDKSNKR
ncbi:WD repeat-containing protein on Y chromosome-like isoform X2 [Convolutriloba macropyga]|uniref:WD repeat-containing protein on Y chromosome-like isoform X2 n=1 Tax=Convolutriloba macropyga TaxID=536237 RepID=UPI003F523F14